MTEQELNDYRKLCQEADDLRQRIERTGENQKAAGEQIMKQYREKLKEAEQKMSEVERFIGSIQEPELRLLFRYRYIDGKKQSWIAQRLNMTQSNVSKLISKKLKVE